MNSGEVHLHDMGDEVLIKYDNIGIDPQRVLEIARDTYTIHGDEGQYITLDEAIWIYQYALAHGASHPGYKKNLQFFLNAKEEWIERKRVILESN